MAQTASRRPIRSAVPDKAAALPYPPSWIDRFMARLQRLPLPYGLTYLMVFFLQVLATHVLGWIDGSLTELRLQPLSLLFPLWTWGPLAIMTYLDEVAKHALRDFQPLLGKGSKQVPRLEYELTTLPARPVIVGGLFWAGVFVILMYAGFPTVVGQFNYGGVAITATWVFGLFAFSTGSAVYYHTVRQLRLVSTTLGLVERVNLFRLDSLYAFARLTAQTGICWLLLSGITLILFPFELVNVVVLALYGTQALFALGAFILPLWNAHRRLVAEKRRLLGEVNRRVERAIERLHQALDGDDMARVKEIDTALGGLASERKVLEGIATWPWSTATISGFVSALVLPIALFVIQLALKNWLGV